MRKNPHKSGVLSSSMLSQFFPWVRFSTEYGGSVLTAINFTVKTTFEFSFIGDQSKKGVALKQWCKQMVQENPPPPKVVFFPSCLMRSGTSPPLPARDKSSSFPFFPKCAVSCHYPPCLWAHFPLLLPVCKWNFARNERELRAPLWIPTFSCLVLHTLIRWVPATFPLLIIDRLFLPPQFPLLAPPGSLLVFLACNSSRWGQCHACFQPYVN